MDAFNHLILFGESQPSNGTVRKVFPPNGETTFAIAYGDAPDKDLRELLVCYPHGSPFFDGGGLSLALGIRLHEAWGGSFGT